MDEQRAKYRSFGNKDQVLRSSDGKRRSSEPVYSVRANGYQGKIKQEAENPEKQSAMQTFVTGNMYMRGRVMSEGAEQLSQKEIDLLDRDIFKPLDFNEILFNRMKECNKGKIVTSMKELCEYLENNWGKKWYWLFLCKYQILQGYFFFAIKKAGYRNDYIFWHTQNRKVHFD